MKQHPTSTPRHPADVHWSRRHWLQAVAAAGLGALALPHSRRAWAADAVEPVNRLDKPVRIIVAYGAGGASDSIARYVGDSIAQRSGKSVIVENKPGADGNIAAEAVVRAPGDSYNLLVSGSSTHAANATIYKKLGYNPTADFTPLANMASTPYAMIVNPKRITQTGVADFIAWAKKEGQPLSFASANVGGRIAGERFKQLTKINAVNVPYKSSAQAMTDLIGGQFDFYFCDMLTALPQIKAGHVRALALSGAERVPSLPDVPTVAELGYPGFDVSSWIAIWSAKASTPAPVSAALSQWIGEALASAAGQDFLVKKGLVPTPVTPDYLTMLEERDTRLWGKIIIDAGMQQP
ncbi:Bug family tripartite tricarboxylate transporter substrate binding protein [Diaphorobacter aerolatus]|uniref:Tripartite tricarboxylate transporter substrate binding protein n=1 Tax=Diaphorobacter aerolatus TaxID=1288495 RepID=A0A7H0GM58_9BURK|nr:tripartite tricarboxylate transporter substrate binding protein [Diaphorobacter aerolatus]QNP49374.1 tripartite tricarboxylate transporter substrate binding protein [Diaphorobacter aerolatus]